MGEKKGTCPKRQGKQERMSSVGGWWGLGKHKGDMSVRNSTVLCSGSWEIVSSPHIGWATGSTWGTSSTVTGGERADGLMCRQASYQRSSLLKRRTSEHAGIIPKAYAAVFLVVHSRPTHRLNSVELRAQHVCSWLCKGIYREVLFLTAPGRELC